jgi:DNA polymerase elongation subunit (family B)
MDFYTHFSTFGNNILISGYENGKKFNRKVPYKPYLFIPSRTRETGYQSVDKKPVRRIDFDTIQDAKEFISNYADVPNYKIYGLPFFNYTFVYDNFKDIQVDTGLIRIFNTDIETDSQDGYGDSQLANREIISITSKIFGDNNVYVVGRRPYETKEKELLELIAKGYKIHYRECKSEAELLNAFLKIYLFLSPDIITGWNVQLFDIPYIIKRMKRLDENMPKKLSPFGQIFQSSVEIYGKQNDKFEILGVPTMDYMDMFKKFSFTNQESYSLNYISGEVLKATKLDYSQYGSLARLWVENHDMFIDYNIIDVIRVEQIDGVKKYFEQVFSITYESLVNYVDTLTTIRTWDILIHNYLMDRSFVVPTEVNNRQEGIIAGGYVKHPQIGKHRWVMSFDFRSLYPHLIMAFNISPETLRGQLDEIIGEMAVEKILDGGLDRFRELLLDKNLTVTGKGTLYTRDEQGFLPAIMETFFDRRLSYQDKEKTAEAYVQEINKELIKRGIEVDDNDE